MRCTDCRRKFDDDSGRKYGRCSECKALGQLLVELHRPPPRLSASDKADWRRRRTPQSDRRHNGESM